MVERLVPSEQNPKETLIWALRELGYEVPIHPGPYSEYPRQWLIRGETRTDRLITAEDFIPQNGAMGTFGVFFGDAVDPVMCCTNGIYYVYNRETVLHGKVIILPSDDYRNISALIAQEHHLNPFYIGDGTEIESILFHEHFVYQKESGVVTIPCPIPIAAAHAIIVPKSVKENLTQRIAPCLEKKIVIH